jgi:hypothetical protein
MAGFRGLHGNWRKNGHRYFPDKDVVHLYFLSNPGFTGSDLYGNGLLDEY